MGFGELMRRHRHLSEISQEEKSDRLWREHVRKGAEIRARQRGAH